MSGGFCQECREPSDLGAKCRPCYRRWQADLYADIPRHHARLIALFKELQGLPAVAKAVACFIMRQQGGVMSGTEAEFVRKCKEALAGPFGGSMEICLIGWMNTEDKAAKPRGRLED